MTLADGPIALPELQDALLDPEALNDLFRDLDMMAEIVDVRTKGAPDAYADSERPSLEAAKQALLQRRIAALQIVYRYQHGEWIDTLMNLPNGVRLVRMQTSKL